MGNLKEDLKAAQSLLKSGQNSEVIELLESYAEEDEPDYRVLCFLALAHANASDYSESYKMYKKAVETDEKQLMAWKGVFKLFEDKSCTTPDEFSLRVCEFIQENSDDDAKKVAAVQARRRILVEMGMWTNIIQSFDSLSFTEDFENLRAVVRRRDAPQNLLSKCLQTLKIADELDAASMLIFCKDSKNEKDLATLINKYKETISDEWVQKKILEYSCQQYFDSKTFPEYVQFVSSASASTMAVLEALRSNDIPSAVEALDEIQDVSTYPDCLLFVNLLAETENWEAVEKLSKSISQFYPSQNCNGWICRALLEIDPDTVEKLQSFGPLPLPDFAVEELKIALLLNNEDHAEQLLRKYDSSSKIGINLRLTQALFSIHPIASDVLNLADQLSGNTCSELVLAAEIRLRAGLDANSLLVKAAKLNVRCSRAFFLLGNSISVKNPTKAKSLIERAVQIRPSNEEYAKALYDVLVKKGVAAEERLKILKAFVSKRRSRRKPFWLSDALSLIYMETDKLSEAIDELQQMVRLYSDSKPIWARLADAYTRKGHLRAAVSSYEQLAEMNDGYEFVVPITRVLLQLRDFNEALDKILVFRQKMDEETIVLGAESSIVLNFTEAEIRLNLHDTERGEQKRHHLKKALEYLTGCLNSDGSSQFATVFKLLGDTLLVISKYSEIMLPYFNIDEKWKVNTPLECVSKAASFYLAVLRSQSHNSLAWYDVAVALLLKFKLGNDPKILSKVQSLLEHAISITADDTLLSSFWTLLAESKRLAEEPKGYQLHCLCRALQLNKSNDDAWLSLAVLCLEMGMMNEASRVLEQSIKHNPHNADAWCTWAQTAHLQSDSHEALAMFRQALFVQPIPAAVVGYSTYLCDSLKKSQHRFDSATAALDFEGIIDLRHLSAADENILYHLGLLADLFGWYPESLECFRLSGSPKISDELQHAMVKTDVLYNRIGIDPSSFSQTNSRICGMLGLSAADCYAFLTAEMEVYGDLYRFIENEDSDSFRKLYMGCVKGISVPLFIAGLIMRKVELPSEFIRTMHEALPRHELIDYYPTALPEGMDNGLRHLEQDGEEPFRYRHRAAYRLLDELKLLRAQLEEENANIVVNEVGNSTEISAPEGSS
ncbi:hypothetical protein CAEBREN_22204 [Caenorhabditis brenneri]|uniref:Uncharacterized protein n=1 Tax=Caenorhabditis brenneri TaxID=135651 RepID=G0MS93_CAEBE|nr:hypothetical protein CAEBREN_22204 [Caenorhabditis brenneri]